MSTRQRVWDNLVIVASQASLLATHSGAYDQARLRASFSPHSGDWLKAPPISSVGLRLDDESIRVALGLRLESSLCAPHTCTCGTYINSRGSHGLACRRRAERQLYPNVMIKDVIWKAISRAQIAAIKEPSGILTDDA